MRLLLPFITVATQSTGDPYDLLDLLRYFAVAVTEGDYLNDWLTHLPPDLAAAAKVLGEWLVNLS